MPTRIILALMLGLLVLPVVAQDEPPPTGEDTGPNIKQIIKILTVIFDQQRQHRALARKPIYTLRVNY